MRGFSLGYYSGNKSELLYIKWMTSPSNELSRQKAELAKSDLYARAAELAVDMALFADTLSAASRLALADTNSSLAILEQGIDWPLTDANSVLAAMRSRVEILMQGRESQTDGMYNYGVDYWGSLKYYDQRDFVGKYNSANPRLAFIADVRGWSNVMAEAGWPLLTKINAAPDDCTVIEVFDETPNIKVHMQQLVEGSAGARRYAVENLVTYSWVDSRVVVFGDPFFIEECIK
jgi:hypothetical protein